MKQIIILLALAILTHSQASRAQNATSSEALVWCGLDYSMAKMIGTGDFRQPENIFPGMLVEWNGLFMREMLPKLEAMAKPLRSDLKAVSARNDQASSTQIERIDGTRDEMVKATHITADDIAELVRSYELDHSDGIGLVFVMDRLVKAQASGCLYIVFFDIASRNVLLSERVIAEARGFGFRNY